MFKRIIPYKRLKLNFLSVVDYVISVYNHINLVIICRIEAHH